MNCLFQTKNPNIVKFPTTGTTSHTARLPVGARRSSTNVLFQKNRCAKKLSSHLQKVFSLHNRILIYKRLAWIESRQLHVKCIKNIYKHVYTAIMFLPGGSCPLKQIILKNPALRRHKPFRWSFRLHCYTNSPARLGASLLKESSFCRCCCVEPKLVSNSRKIHTDRCKPGRCYLECEFKTPYLYEI